jgi:hypothetical protein
MSGMKNLSGAFSIGSCDQLRIERVFLVALDRGLGEHRKFDAIGEPAEIGNFLVAARLLLAEIIGRETNDHQPAILKPGIELFQAVVLLGKTTVAGGIDHKNHLSLPLAE